MSALVAPSGECLRGKGLVWLIGAVVCSLAAYRGSNLALQHHWLWPINCHFNDCKARLVRFPCKTRYIRIRGFSFRCGVVLRFGVLNWVEYREGVKPLFSGRGLNPSQFI